MTEEVSFSGLFDKFVEEVPIFDGGKVFFLTIVSRKTVGLIRPLM
jgi:hypothetical protein